jgi:hypothetical protein
MPINICPKCERITGVRICPWCIGFREQGFRLFQGFLFTGDQVHTVRQVGHHQQKPAFSGRMRRNLAKAVARAANRVIRAA